LISIEISTADRAKKDRVGVIDEDGMAGRQSRDRQAGR